MIEHQPDLIILIRLWDRGDEFDVWKSTVATDKMTTFDMVNALMDAVVDSVGNIQSIVALAELENNCHLVLATAFRARLMELCKRDGLLKETTE